MSETIRPSEISEVLLDQLKAISDDFRYEEVGKTLQVSDGVVRIYGLLNAEAGELLEFDNGVMAVVMNLEAPTKSVTASAVTKAATRLTTIPLCLTFPACVTPLPAVKLT